MPTRPTRARAHGPEPGPAGRHHAVVIGGGLSGLCAAHALSRSFARVTLLDARGPGDRVLPGCGSTWLSTRARSELEWLMPGFRGLLRSEAASHADPGRKDDVAACVPQMVACPDDALFRICNRLLSRHPNVSRRHRMHVIGLRMSEGRFTRVSGVDVSLAGVDPRRARQHLGLDADLVVDASGPASPIARRILDVDRDAPAPIDRLELGRDRSATRRRFSGAHAPPESYLPVGETVLSVPRGLGLRAPVAALSARALEEALAVGSPHEPGFAARFVEGQALRHLDVWRRLELEATRRLPRKIPGALAAARRRYWRACRRGARGDDELAKVVARVDQLLDPPARLLEPRVAWRALGPRRASKEPMPKGLVRAPDAAGGSARR